MNEFSISEINAIVAQVLAEKICSQIGGRYSGKITFQVNCSEGDIRKLVVGEERVFSDSNRI